MNLQAKKVFMNDEKSLRTACFICKLYRFRIVKNSHGQTGSEPKIDRIFFTYWSVKESDRGNNLISRLI